MKSWWQKYKDELHGDSARFFARLTLRLPAYTIVIALLCCGVWYGGGWVLNYAVDRAIETAMHPVNATKQMAADTKKAVVNGVNGAIDSTRDGLGKAKDATVDAVSGAAEVTVREAENLGSGVADWWRGFWGSKQSKQK